MGQILGPDKINDPVVSSVTVVTLPGQNIITIGGQQYVMNNPTMDSAVTGIGGLDIGPPIAANPLYNLFAVISGGVAGLVGSVSAAPAGFLVYTLVGRFGATSPGPDITYAEGVDSSILPPLYVENYLGSNFTVNNTSRSQQISRHLMTAANGWRFDRPIQFGIKAKTIGNFGGYIQVNDGDAQAVGLLEIKGAVNVIHESSLKVQANGATAVSVRTGGGMMNCVDEDPEANALSGSSLVYDLKGWKNDGGDNFNLIECYFYALQYRN